MKDTLTIINDFHNTEIRLHPRREGQTWYLTPRQYARAQKGLCGMADCSCGGIHCRTGGGASLIVDRIEYPVDLTMIYRNGDQDIPFAVGYERDEDGGYFTPIVP